MIMQWLIIIMEGSKMLYYSLEFPWAREWISSTIIDNLGTCPQEGSPALQYTVPVLKMFWPERSGMSFTFQGISSLHLDQAFQLSVPQNTKFSAAIAPFCVSKLEMYNSSPTGSTAKLPLNSTNGSFKHSKLILELSCVMCFLFVTIFVTWIVSMPADKKNSISKYPN